MAALGVSLLALSTAAIVAVAQPRPDDIRGVASDAVTVSVRAAAPTVGFAEASVAEVARIAGSREVSSTSERATSVTPAHHHTPVVTDWSTRHVVFAKPRTKADEARLEHDTRYKMQVARRNASALRKVADVSTDSDLSNRFSHRVLDPRTRPSKANALHRDWSVEFNPTATSGATPTVGDNQFPAKFSFDINEPITTSNCTTDFVVYNTNTPTLVAFNNLYSGAAIGVTAALCGAAPTPMWAYTVATNSGVTSTSTTVSFDATGSTVIVVESSTAGSVLHILKWNAGDGVTGGIVDTTPPTPAAATTGTWANCGGGQPACMWSINFTPDPTGTTDATDSNSAPFYDYTNDVLYVGDDNGYVHEFINVLYGGSTAPSEAGGNWPLELEAGHPALTGPILDSLSGRIFIGDSFGNLDHIETTTGTCLRVTTPTYPCMSDKNFNAGQSLVDPPVVDSSLGTVLIFDGFDLNNVDGLYHAYAAQSSTTTGACICGGGISDPELFTIADFGPVNVGNTPPGSGGVIHSGDFDNDYYTGTGTGYMYVCAIDPNGALGFTGGTSLGGNTALRRMIFNSDGTINTVDTTDYLDVSTTPTDECSPVTEVYNPTGVGGIPADFMFFSVRTNSDPLTLVNCGHTTDAPAGGCLGSLNVIADATTGTFPLVFTASLPEDGGTSGIVVDNVSPDAQASSIYFSPLGDATSPGDCTYVGCAVKATQNGLN